MKILTVSLRCVYSLTKIKCNTKYICNGRIKPSVLIPGVDSLLKSMHKKTKQASKPLSEDL